MSRLKEGKRYRQAHPGFVEAEAEAERTHREKGMAASSGVFSLSFDDFSAAFFSAFDFFAFLGPPGGPRPPGPPGPLGSWKLSSGGAADSQA
jgi:hypothetical protein